MLKNWVKQFKLIFGSDSGMIENTSIDSVISFIQFEIIDHIIKSKPEVQILDRYIEVHKGKKNTDFEKGFVKALEMLREDFTKII